MNRAAEQALSNVEKISERIVKVTFAGNPVTTIFVVYSPTNVRGNDIATDLFYEQLSKAIDEVPPHNLLAVVGDWNAKIGPAHVKFAHDKRTNENGTRLLDLTCEKSLIIANTLFQKRMGKRWSFEDPKGNRYLLDYILFNSKWKNSIQNAECYSSFASTGSDHRIVTAEVRLSLRATAAPVKKKLLNWRALRDNTAMQTEFSLTLHNRFEALCHETSSIDEQYDAFVEAHKLAAEETLPVIQRSKQQKHSNHPEIVKARKRVNQLTTKYNTQKSTIVRKHLKEAKEVLQQQYQLAEDETLRRQISEVELDFHNSNTANAWRTVNLITGRKAPALGKLSGKSQEERAQKWFEHFKKLLGTPKPLPSSR